MSDNMRWLTALGEMHDCGRTFWEDCFRECLNELDRLRAENARQRAWIDGVMNDPVKAVIKRSNGLAFISTLCPDNGNQLEDGEYVLQIRPAPFEDK